MSAAEQKREDDQNRMVAKVLIGLFIAAFVIAGLALLRGSLDWSVITWLFILGVVIVGLAFLIEPACEAQGFSFFGALVAMVPEALLVILVSTTIFYISNSSGNSAGANWGALWDGLIVGFLSWLVFAAVYCAFRLSAV